MPARPGNWSLLTDDGKDPVAGDPDEVRRQAGYYSTMAETILKEAHRLKTLGQDDELVGKYKKSLQDELGDLSDEVHKAHQRYESVGTALKPYATALDTAKSESAGALKDAEHAHTAQTKANGMPNPQSKDGKPLSDDDKTAQKNRTKAISAAGGDLDAAKKRLHTALTHLNDAGKKAADEIDDGSNDKLKDHHHWWDVVVKILKVVVEVLNYVVIVLAIAALFVTGLGLIIFILSAVILAIDLTLALTGNASWTDVIIDVIGLATCGVGGGLAKGGEVAVKSAGKAGAKLVAREVADRAGLGFIRRTTTYFGRRGFAKTFMTNFLETSGKDTKALAGLKVGDKGMAESLTQLKALATKFPDSAKIANRLATVERFSKVTRVTGFAGLFSVMGNTAFSPSNIPGYENVKPFSETFNDYKESHVSEGKSGHAFDFKWNDLDYSPSSVFETSGPRQK